MGCGDSKAPPDESNNVVEKPRYADENYIQGQQARVRRASTVGFNRVLLKVILLGDSG